MPRSRRFLTLCALVAALAWTNVQAMACCWTWSSEHQSVATQANLVAEEPIAEAGCHGAAATEKPDSSPPTTQDHHAAHSESEKTSSPTCGAAFTSSQASPSDCCDTFAPAENFSAVPHFEALPPHAFDASATLEPPAAYSSLQSHIQAPASPRFLALERLLI